ncbi:MAG: fructosamine kinase family protein [Treponema sp.]|nr:fructosamine kinase family protein [Treponema sp.]
MSAQTVNNFTTLAGALVGLYGRNVQVAQTDRLSSGGTSKAYGLHLTNGAHIFMKANARKNAGFFTAEAACLAAIASTGKIGTPEVLCTGTDPGEQEGYSFLLLEYVESYSPINSYWETFGHELAELHNSDCSGFVREGKYGFIQDNYIGAAEQTNNARNSWVDFYRDCRLAPQFRKASRCFSGTMQSRITKLLERLDSYIVEPDRPSLLHGDLWSGNVICGPEGKVFLIDPASYCGCNEADIAMTQLFGGFPEEFYRAYNEVKPQEPGYESRRDMYNLYHLLNHLNLFGAAYLEPVCSIVDEYV